MDRLTPTLLLTVALLAGASSAGDPAPDYGDTQQPWQSPELWESRRRMLDYHLRGRGISERVVHAMARVPREEFVPEELRTYAYSDSPLPIGLDQTISQPFIVAFMTDAVSVKPGDRVLEIGTGSGYQAAVLAELADTVYTVEIIPELTERATATLLRLGYYNIVTATRDGYRGWPEHAPFDIVVVTAAPDHVPQPLLDQLAPGGRMVIPVGSAFQQLRLIRKGAGGEVESRDVLDVRFVPMTGEALEGGR